MAHEPGTSPVTEASPADVRNNLASAAVDAVADQLHGMSCLRIGEVPQDVPAEHRDADRSKARFVLMGLRESGWLLDRDACRADAIHQYLTDKVDAGAALVYAIYHHPRAVELLKEFGSSKGFFDALGRAQRAYRVREDL